MPRAGRAGRPWGWGPAALLAAVGILVLLTSASHAEPWPAQDDDCPIINLRLDPRRKMLTWNYVRNVSEHECIIETPDYSTRVEPRATADLAYACDFPNSPLHRGANLTVNATCHGATSRRVLAVANPGREGSGAVDFSCLLYSVRFMRCHWAPGPAAPADVQYRLFSWASRHEAEAECAHYVVDATGTRVGCRFDELGEPRTTDNYFFWLNGTSRETEIPFLDFTPFNPVENEKYDPPANVTVAHNGSHRVLRWENPQVRFDIGAHMLCYELDIRTAGTSTKTKPLLQRGQDSNVYLMPGPAGGAATTFRVRVRYVYNHIWSEWSPAVRFGLREQDFRGALVGLVVGATAVSALGLMFLCRRFSVGRRLLPPIPQVKEEVAKTLMSVPGVAGDEGHPPPGPQEAEDFVALEVTW